MVNINLHSTEELESILKEADAFSKGKMVKAVQEIYVSNMFFEDSTRTKMSFEVAEKKLGLKIVNFEAEKSSINKGETLLDTIKTLEAIGIRLAVIRHRSTAYYDELQDTKMQIVNAGDGVGEHPSQAVLDVMTIQQEFGKLHGLKVAIVGDVKHSRVANSTSALLSRLGAKVYFSGPEFWFEDAQLIHGTFRQLDDLIKEVDVLILLRIQNERHEEKMSMSAEEYLQKYGLTKEREQLMKSRAIVMHPAPINRGVEIDSDLVECSRSRIFKQMENGVFARMAILKAALEKKGFEFKEL